MHNFNRLLARANVRRLEFEPLRDSLLASPASWTWRSVGTRLICLKARTSERGIGRVRRKIPEFRLAAASRRTVYGYVDRADPIEEFNTFDVANPSAPTGKRYETIVPQQALFLMNSPCGRSVGTRLSRRGSRISSRSLRIEGQACVSPAGRIHHPHLTTIGVACERTRSRCRPAPDASGRRLNCQGELETRDILWSDLFEGRKPRSTEIAVVHRPVGPRASLRLQGYRHLKMHQRQQRGCGDKNKRLTKSAWESHEFSSGCLL